MIVSRIHILLALAVITLMAVGIAVLASAGFYSKEGGGLEYSLINKQLMWGAGGCVLLTVAWFRDFHELYRLRWWLFGLAVLMLILCFVPVVGQKINGASRWIRFGGFQFQPSEFAKIALAITLAAWFSRHEAESRSFVKGCGIPFALMAVIAGLIGIEMDLGSALITCAMSFCCMYVGGTKKRYLPTVGAVILIAALIAASSNENRTKRIRAFISELPVEVATYGVKLPFFGHIFDLSKMTPDEMKKIEESKLQQDKGIMAFGSGGLLGAGLGQGRMVMYGLPEAHTDFILPNVGEEFGLVGTLTVVLCFVCIVISGMCISAHAPTRFGKLLGLSVTALIGFEGVVNMFVTTGLFPNKGLPLPLVSYGGSSLLMTLIAIGILFSIHRQGVYVKAEDLKMLNRKRRWTPSV
jgi:cell division protein FtsW